MKHIILAATLGILFGFSASSYLRRNDPDFWRIWGMEFATSDAYNYTCGDHTLEPVELWRRKLAAYSGALDTDELKAIARVIQSCDYLSDNLQTWRHEARKIGVMPLAR